MHYRRKRCSTPLNAKLRIFEVRPGAEWSEDSRAGNLKLRRGERTIARSLAFSVAAGIYTLDK